MKSNSQIYCQNKKLIIQKKFYNKGYKKAFNCNKTPFKLFSPIFEINGVPLCDNIIQ